MELGANNELLWHLPLDFKWFVKHTKGKTLLMGSNTMRSLPGALKDRRNCVLSSNRQVLDGFEWVKDLEQAADGCPELMIIGGAQVYKQFLHLADRLYITQVNANFEQADVFFPKYEGYEQIYKEYVPKDEKHAYDFEFLILEK